MTKVAIVYASKLGKTRKTAKYIANELKADSFDLKKQTNVNLSEYEHIIFGTGVRAGKPYKSVVEFVKNNTDQLAGKQTSLFLCCMYNAEKGENQLKKISDEFGIKDAFSFAGKGEKDEEGISVEVDNFIKEMSQR